jgi:hypothetical protein
VVGATFQILLLEETMNNLQVGDSYVYYKLQTIGHGGLVSDGYSSHPTMETVKIAMRFGFERFQIEGFVVTPVKVTKTHWSLPNRKEEQEPTIYYPN